jgi:hypothetical protein
MLCHLAVSADALPLGRTSWLDALPPCCFSGCFAAGSYFLVGCFATYCLIQADAAAEVLGAISGRMLHRLGCGCRVDALSPFI